jgi:peptidyl-prolyl cis-trans isomerase C
MRQYLSSIMSLVLISALLACSMAKKPIPAPVAEPRPSEKILTASPAPPKPPTPNQPPKETVVARINGKAITLAEFDRIYQDYLLNNRDNGSTAKSKEEFLQKVVADTLLQQYAEAHGADREQLFQRELEQTRNQLLIDYFTREKLFRNIQVSNAEIEQYYNSHLEDYTQPEKIQARLILTNTIEEAQQALERLRAGERFADVARDLSIHSSRANGGLLDPFTRGTYNKSFEDAAFALKVGDLSDIIKTDAGFSIIEKTAEIPRQIKPLSAVRGRISEILLSQKEHAVLQEFIAQLKSGAQIETFPIP